MEKKLNEADLFISTMERLYRDKATRSIIKRATTDKMRENALFYLTDLSIENKGYKRELVFTLAACYMAMDKHETSYTFGQSCRMASINSGIGGKLSDSFTICFKQLLAGNKRNILTKMEKIIRRINSNKVAINFYQLYNDLIRFEKDPHEVKFGWMFNYMGKRS